MAKRSGHTAANGSILPYPLFEFGFPTTISTGELAPIPQFPPGPADEFMRSEDGRKLRRDEAKYSAMVRQMIIRNTRLTGAALLFLGCGSSRNMLKLLRRAPRQAVFVDVDANALARLKDLVRAEGLDAMVQIEYVLQDAYTWVADAAEAYLFDAVIATKCIGQILKGGRDLATLVDNVGGLLRHGGHFYCDHHVCAAKAPEGTPVADIVSPDDFNLATIFGRYGDDVAFDVSTGFDDFQQLAHFFSSLSPTGVQVWHHHVYRFLGRAPIRRTAVVTLSPPAQPPVPFRAPPRGEVDTIAEGMMPVNAKGVKRIVTHEDVKAHPAATSMPKFDGEPGVLLIDGAAAVFVSPANTFSRALRKTVSAPLSLFAELVDAGAGKSVIVVTGVIEVDASPCDPLDPGALSRLEPIIDALYSDGIMINSPRLLRHIDEDRVVLGATTANPVSLPVDGIQLTLGGRNGVFIKPSLLCTIDAIVSQAVDLIHGASFAAGAEYAPKVLLPQAPPEEVWEFAQGEDFVWFPVRHRKDKTHSDGPGAAVHTVWAAHWARSARVGMTVASTRARVLY